MQKLYTCLLLWLPTLALAQAQEPAPIIDWIYNSYDFGDTYEGEEVQHTFQFTNKGNAPLFIANVAVTCGCTTPVGWSQDPILPGKWGKITIAFDTSGKTGAQKKVAVVVTNAKNGQTELLLEANVVPKPTP